MFCDKCGKELAPGSIFCPNCGAKQPEEEPSAEMSASSSVSPVREAPSSQPSNQQSAELSLIHIWLLVSSIRPLYGMMLIFLLTTPQLMKRLLPLKSSIRRCIQIMPPLKLLSKLLTEPRARQSRPKLMTWRKPSQMPLPPCNTRVLITPK